jgi:hypothetical protein
MTTSVVTPTSHATHHGDPQKHHDQNLQAREPTFAPNPGAVVGIGTPTAFANSTVRLPHSTSSTNLFSAGAAAAISQPSSEEYEH